MNTLFMLGSIVLLVVGLGSIVFLAWLWDKLSQ